MDDRQRRFLDELLSQATPSGFETPGQRAWIDYLEPIADEIRVDDYGNAVAVYDGDEDAPEVAVAGHADEIGLMVRDITDDGFLALSRIGGSDKTVTRGQHVTVHTAEGPLDGVVGQVAIHLREGDDEPDAINEQYADIGAEDGEAARELVDIGDPITFDTAIHDLEGSLVSARGMDNRVGVWTAAETFRRAVESEPATTVYAVSTVQEELGLRGARMVGFDLDPDAAVAADVTHATDTPEAPGSKGSGIELGEGPVVARGSANHPALVEAARTVAAEDGPEIQLQASGSYTGTDADAFYTSRGGIPSLNLGLPNRYMHTPVEVVDLEDLDAAADLLSTVVTRAEEFAPFGVDI
jgi:putative aminopeptidase FrvX